MDTTIKIIAALALVGYAIIHLAIWRMQERDQQKLDR